MFEQHIDRVFIDLMDKIAFGGGFAYVTDIVGMAPISRPWRAYLLAEVDWWVYEQQMARLGNPNFDFAHEEFIYAFQHLDSLYAEKARFTNDNLTKILKTAVKTRLNMLLRPRTTLKWFVFRGEPTKPYREIILRLNYLNDYKYISDGFVAHVERNQFLRTSNDIMSVTEFEKIIDEVDNEKIFNVTPQEFLDMVEPMFGFFNNEMAPEESDTIPTAALAIFFDDKGIFVLSKKLKQAIKNGESEISRRFLADFIYSSIEDSDRPDYTPETALPIASSAGFSLADELARFNQSHKTTQDLPDFGLGAMPESFFPKPLADSDEETSAETIDGAPSDFDEPDSELGGFIANQEDGQDVLAELQGIDALGSMAEPSTAGEDDEYKDDALGIDENALDGLLSEYTSTEEEIAAEEDAECEIQTDEAADLLFADAQPEDTIETDLEIIESEISAAETDILSIDGNEISDVTPAEALESVDTDSIGLADNEDDDLSGLLAKFKGLGFDDDEASTPIGEAQASSPTQEEKLSMIMETLSESIDVDQMRRDDERRKLEESMREAAEDKILELNNASTSLDFLNLPQSSGEDESGFIVFDDDISEDLLNIAFKNKDTE